jgi:hypothetical protein
LGAPKDAGSVSISGVLMMVCSVWDAQMYAKYDVANTRAGCAPYHEALKPQSESCISKTADTGFGPDRDSQGWSGC